MTTQKMYAEAAACPKRIEKNTISLVLPLKEINAFTLMSQHEFAAQTASLQREKYFLRRIFLRQSENNGSFIDAANLPNRPASISIGRRLIDTVAARLARGEEI